MRDVWILNVIKAINDAEWLLTEWGKSEHTQNRKGVGGRKRYKHTMRCEM